MSREMIGKFIGAQVAAHRHAQRWTQTDLADQVGVSRQAVALWEGGDLPAIETLYRLGEVFSIEPFELLPTLKQAKAR